MGKEIKINKDINLRFILGRLIFPSILIGLTAFSSHFVIEKLKKNTKTPIIIGFTEYSILGTRFQKSGLIEDFEKEANELLGEYQEDYKIIIKIIKGNYEEIFRALKYDKIDIALIPPYTWIYSHFDENLRKKSKIDDFEILGYKYPTEGIWYYTGLLYNRNVITNEDLEINELHKLNFILNKEKKSTSTFVIPTYEMILNMVQLPDSSNIIQLSREEMFEKISILNGENKKYVGFIQSDEYDKLKNLLYNQNDLRAKDLYTQINNLKYQKNDTIPIPYDIVIGKSNSMKKIPYSKIIESLKSLFLSVNKLPLDENNWFENNENFIKMVLSGVLKRTQKEDGKKYEYSLYFLNDSLHQNHFIDSYYYVYQIKHPIINDNFKLNYPQKWEGKDSIKLTFANETKYSNNILKKTIKNHDTLNAYLIKHSLNNDISSKNLFFVPKIINDSLSKWKKYSGEKNEDNKKKDLKEKNKPQNGFYNFFSTFLFIFFFCPIVLILFVGFISLVKKS